MTATDQHHGRRAFEHGGFAMPTATEGASTMHREPKHEVRPDGSHDAKRCTVVECVKANADTHFTTAQAALLEQAFTARRHGWRDAEAAAAAALAWLEIDRMNHNAGVHE